MAKPAGVPLNLDGGDPRMGSSAGIVFGYTSQITCSAFKKLRDSSVSFEEWINYAAIMHADDRAVMPAHTHTVYTVSGLKTSNLSPRNPSHGHSDRSEREGHSDFARLSPGLYCYRGRLRASLPCGSYSYMGCYLLPYDQRYSWPFFHSVSTLMLTPLDS